MRANRSQPDPDMGTSENLRARAIGLLARREYTRAELKRKLAAEPEMLEQIDPLLDDLASRSLLSDARYAEQRVSARGRRLGNSRLRHELQTAGVAPELIDSTLAGAASETERAKELWKRKFGSPAADRNEQAKQTRFLQMRGFSSDVIRQVLRDAIEECADE